MNLKPNQSPPIVPHVLVVGDRLHPYKLPKIECVEVLYSTATQVKLSGGKSKAARLVYCITDNGAWIEFLEWYELLQTALDKLADNLRTLGHYPDKLKAAGGLGTAPNPLTPEVIWAPCPDYNHSAAGLSNWEVYPTKRLKDGVVKHTPQMLKLLGNQLQEYTTQADHFCCPDSIAWHKFGNLHNAAVFQSKCLLKFLEKLGTYEEAAKDNRYKNSKHSDQDSDIKVGDRVSFIQSWNGNLHQFEGVVQKLNNPTNTALVHYKVPAQLQDNVERPYKLQAPIGLFALSIALPKDPSIHVAKPDLDALKPPCDCKIDLPPEPLEDQISSQINSLQSQGSVAPNGVWIESCKVSGSTFRQAYWRSRDPCFTPKRGINLEAKCRKQYIGKEGSDAHKTAIATIERRNKINQLTKQLPKTHHEH